MTVVEDTVAVSSSELAEQITSAQAELAEAKSAEAAAAGTGTPEEHHRLADAVRWHTARVEQLARDLEAAHRADAETRRQDAHEQARHLLEDEHPLHVVADTYSRAVDALHALVTACRAREDAVTRAAQVLDSAGAGPRPGTGSVRVAGTTHTRADVDAATLVVRAAQEVAGQCDLQATRGPLESALDRLVPSTRRAVPKLAADRRAAGA